MRLIQTDAVVINGRPRMIQGKPFGWSVDSFTAPSMDVAQKITSNEEIIRCHGPSNLYRR